VPAAWEIQGAGQKSRWVKKGVRCALIDGETLKPDVWYILKNGECVAAGDECFGADD
jgi:hypothetical protein